MNSSRFRFRVGLGVAVLWLTAVGALGLDHPATASAAPRRTSAAPLYYLALGDSVPVWNGRRSYPYLILAHYRRALPGLRLKDLAVSGATTQSMLGGGEYDAALRFLAHRRGHVALITIDIGGNDVVFCVGPAGISQTCATQARETIRHNLTKMLAGLRAAAPRVPIFGMTYYNPFLGDWLAGSAARSLTLGTTPGLLALNHELTRLYGGAHRTADVQGAFAATDIAAITSSRWGRVPVAVNRACSWLDIVCKTGAVERFGDDPNPIGATVIARAFERKIGRLDNR